MRAINHALTGALIGISVGKPLLALPAAFASHLVLDAVPHFGEAKDDIGSPLFKKLLVFDAVACLTVVIALVMWQPRHWLVACFAAFVAASPDLFFIPAFLRARKSGSSVPQSNNWFVKFHMNIQWFQRPSGAVVEVVWFIGSIVALISVAM